VFAADKVVEVFVDLPLDAAKARVPKGLYREARCSELSDCITA